MGTTEQARAPRVDFPGETIVYVGNRQVVCDAVNLSASGMLIAERAPGERDTARPAIDPLQLRHGQFMRLVFSLKSKPDRYIDADAVVVRAATERGRRSWGLQFVSLPGHVSAAIGVYVGNRITEAARMAGRLARRNEAWKGVTRDVTPADLLDASGSSSFGEDGTPLRELYREALAEVERPSSTRRR